MRTFAAAWLLAPAMALAAAPQSGLWWNPNESGRGYALDAQGGTLVVTTFAYGPDGRMQWYYADGPLLSGGASWSGTLLKFDLGQPLSGAYRAPTLSGNDGAVSISFASRSTGTMTIGGRQIPIQRQNFAVGNAPQSLLGSWLYGYSIGTSTFAERFDYTAITSPTSSGTGVVIDSGRRGTAELQVTGTFAGRVVAFQFNAAGSAINQYYYTQYLEEGRGFWVSPTTFNEYGMNAYRFGSPQGIDKVALDEDGTLAAREGAGVMGRKAITLDELTALNPELGTLAKAMWSRLSETR
ncbi:hypothetical protein BWI17_17320 [Betaproteobacteria bacterium GR16-43]|nr:hypothetical protein BWI17_17320 [Betaproteobacteria bacterium GR16-43]